MTHQPRPVVLLIDDDPSFTYLIERYGQVSACRIISAPTLEAAGPLVHAEPPSLVILQVGLPGGPGWNLVRLLKADTALRTVPVALCGSVTDSAGMRDVDADYWLSKPVMYADFEAVLAASVSQGRLMHSQGRRA